MKLLDHKFQLATLTEVLNSALSYFRAVGPSTKDYVASIAEQAPNFTVDMIVVYVESLFPRWEHTDSTDTALQVEQYVVFSKSDPVCISQASIPIFIRVRKVASCLSHGRAVLQPHFLLIGIFAGVAITGQSGWCGVPQAKLTRWLNLLTPRTFLFGTQGCGCSMANASLFAPAFIALGIARSAPCRVSVAPCCTFIKFGNWLERFTFRTELFADIRMKFVAVQNHTIFTARLQSVCPTSIVGEFTAVLKPLTSKAPFLSYNFFGQDRNLHRLGFVLARLDGLFRADHQAVPILA